MADGHRIHRGRQRRRKNGVRRNGRGTCAKHWVLHTAHGRRHAHNQRIAHEQAKKRRQRQILPRGYRAQRQGRASTAAAQAPPQADIARALPPPPLSCKSSILYHGTPAGCNPCRIARPSPGRNARLFRRPAQDSFPLTRLGGQAFPPQGKAAKTAARLFCPCMDSQRQCGVFCVQNAKRFPLQVSFCKPLAPACRPFVRRKITSIAWHGYGCL